MAVTGNYRSRKAEQVTRRRRDAKLPRDRVAASRRFDRPTRSPNATITVRGIDIHVPRLPGLISVGEAAVIVRQRRRREEDVRGTRRAIFVPLVRRETEG